jgi:iron complex outermembrane receptor protein
LAIIAVAGGGTLGAQEKPSPEETTAQSPENETYVVPQEGEVTVLERLVVTTPLFGAPDTATRSVTLLTREDIEEQQKLTRNASRDLFNIDPAVIESIEVIHGGSALYGGGATGGIVYITTLQGGGEPRFMSRVTLGNSLTNPSADGLLGSLAQSAEGSTGNTSYAFAASGDVQRGSFDSKGDRIAPEPSQGDLHDTAGYDLMARLGHDVDQHHFGTSINYRNLDQNTDFASDPSVAALPPGSAHARALPGLVLNEQGMLRDLRATADYASSDILGGSLAAQLYVRDYQTRFYPFDGRKIPTWGVIAQSIGDSRVYGGHANLRHPLADA